MVKNFTAEKVAVIGLGYVGLPLAVLAKKAGHDVMGFDISQRAVDAINQGKSPFLDEELEADLKTTGIEATTDFAHIKNFDIVIICVPTPVHANNQPDLGPVIGACRSIGANLKNGALIILESTVNPGVSETIVLPTIEEEIGKSSAKQFFLAHCPERINPGDPKWNVHNIPRVVGSLDREGLEKAAAFYRGIIDAEIYPMNTIKEAEAVKVVENSFRDINIAFANELAISFAKLGIDVVNVINGAATKPFAFMAHYPGVGVGGHCIPVDPYYLIEYAKQSGFDHDFLSLARRINKSMPEYVVELTMDGLNEVGLALNGSKVALLGLSYKPGVGDLRESPSMILIDLLEKKGADISAYDPYIKSEAAETGYDSTKKKLRGSGTIVKRGQRRKSFEVVDSLDQALRDASVVIVATAHPEFKRLQASKLKAADIAMVMDGRNCLEKSAFESAGLVYRGVGR